jgi:hypothetical protein
MAAQHNGATADACRRDDRPGPVTLKTPRIAIALFGIPRGSATTMPTLVQHFIGPARQIGDCRVFYHLYRQDRVVNARSGEDAAMPDDAYAPFAAFDGELEAPELCLEQWRFDKIQAFGDHYVDEFRSLRNLVHQLHSLRQVTARLTDWQPDVVLFMRPDLLYHGGFARATIADLCSHPRRCVLPEWHWWGGYNDRFALCGADVFRGYGNRVELALDFSQRTGRPLQAERLVRYALHRANASVRTTPIRANRVRVNGQMKPEDFSAGATAGSIRRHLEMGWLRLLTQLSI